jgi:hypothetical protein
MGENDCWEYADLYFIGTWTSDRNYGPHLAVVEDGKGARLIFCDRKINTMNLLGADGWIIDSLHYSRDIGNIPPYVNALAMSVRGVGSVGDGTVQSMRRKVVRMNREN